MSTREAAERLGVSLSYIHNMVRRGLLRSTKRVIGGVELLEISEAAIQECADRKTFRKIDDDAAEEMRAARARGDSLLQIARRFDVDISTVSRTVRGLIHAVK